MKSSACRYFCNDFVSHIDFCIEHSVEVGFEPAATRQSSEGGMENGMRRIESCGSLMAYEAAIPRH